MINYEDTCVGCTGMGLHCKGATCPHYKPEMVVTCDECGYDIDEKAYKDGNKHLCLQCLIKKHREDFLADYDDEIFNAFAEEWANKNFDEVIESVIND